MPWSMHVHLYLTGVTVNLNLIERDCSKVFGGGEVNRWKQYWYSRTLALVPNHIHIQNPSAISIDIFTFGVIQVNRLEVVWSRSNRLETDTSFKDLTALDFRNIVKNFQRLLIPKISGKFTIRSSHPRAILISLFLVPEINLLLQLFIEVHHIYFRTILLMIPMYCVRKIIYDSFFLMHTLLNHLSNENYRTQLS